MAIQKLFTSRANGTQGSTYVGERGHLFYDESTGLLRLSDGPTPGGLPVLIASTTANLGDLYVTGPTISTVNPNEDLNLDSNGTGNVNIVGSLRILTSSGFYATTPVLSANQAGNVTVTGNLITNGGTYFIGTSTFVGPIVSTGTRTSQGDSIFNGNVVTNGNLITNGTTTLHGSTTFIGDVVHTGNVTDNGSLTTNGNLTVNGNTVLNGPVTFVGTTTHTGNLVTNGNLITNGSSYFNGNVVEIGNLTVTGTSTNNGNTIFNGITTFNGNTIRSGALTSTGDVTWNGNLITNGASTNNGNSTFNGTVTTNGNLSIVGNTSQQGNLTITGTTINNGVSIFNGNIALAGNIAMTGNTVQTGNTFINGSVTNNGSSLFNGNVDITGNTIIQVTAQDSVQGAVEITGDANGGWQTPVSTGVMLHVTGQSTLPSRIYNDANQNYALLVGRRYDGTMASPSAVQANEDIFRLAGGVYNSAGWANIGPSRISFVASENQTATNQGGRIELWTTANASGPAYANIQRVASIDAAVGVWATQFTTQGNIAASNVAITNNETVGGNVTVTGNITAGNVTATTHYGNIVGTSSTLSGNLTAGNVNATVHGNVIGVASSLATNTTSFATSFLTGQVNIPAQTIPKNTTSVDVTVTVTGLTTSHKVVVTPAADLNSGVILTAAYPTTTNTLGVQLQNTNGGGITTTAFNLTYMAWI